MEEENTLPQERGLLEYSKILLLYWWFIGPCSLIGGVAAFLICQQLPEKYRAVCRFEIFQNRNILQGDENGQQVASHPVVRERYLIARQSFLVQSPTINNKIRNRIIAKYPKLKEHKSNIFELNVEAVKGAGKAVLDVNMDTYSKEAALEYLEELIAAYDKLRQEETERGIDERRQALITEDKRLDKKIDDLQQVIEDFKIENNFIFVETKTKYDRNYISELLEKANEMQFQEEVLRKYLKKLKDKGQDNAAAFSQSADAFSFINKNGGLQSVSSLQQDIGEWKDRQVRLQKIDVEYIIKLRKYKPGHPEMRSIKENVELIKAEQNVYSASVISNITGRLETMLAERQSYLDKARLIEKSLSQHSELANRYEKLQQKLDNFMTRKNKVYAKTISLTDNKNKYFTRMIREPQVLSAPIWPDKNKFTAMGFLFFFGGSSSLVLGFFLSKAQKHNFSKPIHDLDTNYLATIPHFPARKLQKNPFFLNGIDKSTVLAESYRSLRLGIEAQLKGGKSIILTSFSSGEGKTTTSLNLALCWAWSGKKILLVDADFRRCSMRKIFKNAPEEGLMDYMRLNKAKLGNYIVGNICENLSYLPAGHGSEYAMELLETPKMATVMSTLNEYFDIIIFDTAPAPRVTDTLRLCELTDGTVVVGRNGKTKPDEISQVYHCLPKEKILGFLLNDFQATHTRFSNTDNGYKCGYSYQSYKKKY